MCGIRIQYSVDLFDALFSVSDYSPPVPDILPSKPNHLAVYIIAPIAGALALCILIITLVHKYVRPIPPVTTLIRWISNSNLAEETEAGDVELQVIPPGANQPKNIYYSGEEFVKLLVEQNQERPVKGVMVELK